jgi:predicted RNase H-like HicB family nuclease
MQGEYHLGIEDMEPGNWVAWVFEFPGCYARGIRRQAALDSAPAAIEELISRLKQAGFPVSGAGKPVEVSIAEEFRSFPSSPDYLVNAFFENDRIPLSEDDNNYARLLLDLNRNELLAIITGLSEDVLDRTVPGEVQKNVRGIIRHIGSAEWWYWDRLGLAFPRAQRPEDPFDMLKTLREFTLHHLPGLVGSSELTVCLGEKWSPRKLLRRTIWHERVHTLQIARYLKAM